MTDYTQSDWNEIDNDNIGLSPNGIQSGYAPSTVAPILRAIRGAQKRNFVRTNPMYTSTGTGAAYVLTYIGAPTGYTKGEIYRFWAHIQNTGAATININGLGAKSIISRHGAALTVGQIKANKVVEIVYNGTAFELLSGEIVDPKFEGTATITGDLTVSDALSAATFAGNGALITNINGSNIATGTVADARLPGTMTGKAFTSSPSVSSADPWVTFNETDTTTAARVGIATGTTYVQAGGNGSGANSSSGNLLFSGYYGADIGNFQVQHSGAPRTIWHSGNDGSGSGLDADLLDGQDSAFYRNATNLNAGTVADARLPATMSGKTFTGNTVVTGGTHSVSLQNNGSIELLNTAGTAYIDFKNSSGDDYDARIILSGGTTLDFNTTSGNLTHNGSTIWTAANDGSGSGLDADLLDGQDASFFRNASNLNAGTVADGRLPTAMSAKTFTTEISINSTGNSHVWHKLNGVNRGLTYYDPVNSAMNWNLYNTSGNWVRSLSFRESDGVLSVPGDVSASNLVLGAAAMYSDGNIKFAGTMQSNYGDYLSTALAARIKNDGGTYGINITGNAATATRAYPRRSDGGNMNFMWSGQGGQPTWLWGGTDGTNMYVYNPSNFSVNYANGAGYAAGADNADTVDGLHASAFQRAPYTLTTIGETNYPVGHIVLFDGYHDMNQSVNLYYNSGNSRNLNYSGVGTLLSGTWRMRGSFSSPQFGLAQRVA
jgi:hypothetical protein